MEKQLTIFDVVKDWRRSTARASALAAAQGDEEGHLRLWAQLADDIGDTAASELVAVAAEELR